MFCLRQTPVTVVVFTLYIIMYKVAWLGVYPHILDVLTFATGTEQDMGNTIGQSQMLIGVKTGLGS